jgi:hypothetical protein
MLKLNVVVVSTRPSRSASRWDSGSTGGQWPTEASR